MRGVYSRMSKRQKAKFKNAVIYGSLLTSMCASGLMSELLIDRNPYAISSAIICSAYMILFGIANRVWE